MYVSVVVLFRQLFIKFLALRALLRQLFIKILALRAPLRQLFIKKIGFAGSAPATLHKIFGFAGSAPATLQRCICTSFDLIHAICHDGSVVQLGRWFDLMMKMDSFDTNFKSNSSLIGNVEVIVAYNGS
jgi:hypothetical protein